MVNITSLLYLVESTNINFHIKVSANVHNAQNVKKLKCINFITYLKCVHCTKYAIKVFCNGLLKLDH